MPFMLLLGDIRQGIFYAQLLSFWLVFAGEHMLIQDDGGASTLKLYWKHLSAVVTGCLSLFVFDVCERGAQVRNPFYSIWVTKIGANIAVRNNRRKNNSNTHSHIHFPINNIILYICSSFLLYWRLFRQAFTFCFYAI